MTTATPTHMFSADRPITTAREDLLGRAPFANSLAASIGSWRGKDSLVVALYGSWGIGKSSIKNMVIEGLQAAQDPPHIVEFNPWQWSGHDQVAEGFFTEIGRILRRGANAKEARKREYAWRAYASRLGIPLLLADGTRRLATWILSIGGIIALVAPAAAACLPKAATYTPFILASVVLFAFAALVRFAKDFTEQLAARASAQAVALEQRTLTEEKSVLRNLLADLDRPVIVIIDDIDRLRPNEVRLLFQLVKANADFPNLTFLLLFQRDIVERALQNESNTEQGREFLEKIIQVGFDVPSVEPERLHKALFQGLNNVLSGDAIDKRFDQVHWQSTFPAIRGFYRNLRDVARFLGCLSFHASLFRRDNSFEVNPVDLIAIEAIRLFEPNVFAMIRGNKDVLTAAAAPLESRRDRDNDRSIVESILAQASAERRESTNKLLRELFPGIRTTFGGAAHGDGYADVWFRTSRVCHPKVFDRYFLLTLPEGDVSQAELDYLIENSSNRDLVSCRLRDYGQSGRIEAMLDRLESYKQSLPPSNIRSFITAIMDIGDLLPERSPGLFFLSADMHASRFVHWSLREIGDLRERASILCAACLETTGIVLPLREVAEQEAKEHADDSPDSYFLDDEQIQKCILALVARIRSRAQQDLELTVFLAPILLRWKAWTSPEEVTDWVHKLLDRETGVVIFLNRMLSKSSSTPMFGGSTTVHHRLSPKLIREFVDPQTVQAAIQRLDATLLTDTDRIGIEAFRKAMKRESEGKQEDQWGLDD